MGISRHIKRLRESAWRLGILVNGYVDLKSNNIIFINNGIYEGKKWFADPFILSYNENEVVALVEEYDYKINRGRIAKIVIDRSTWTITNCIILLDLSTHLSFPIIYRQQGKVFVCPENYSGEGLIKYEYDPLSEKLLPISLLSNKLLVDTVIRKFGDYFYMFSTNEPTPNGNILTVYKAFSFDGPFLKNNDVYFEDNVARNAGDFFYHDGKLIRPAQESNYSYGHSIVFQEIYFNKGVFTFREEWRYLSTHPTFKLGAHTYNEFEGMGIIDFKGYRYPVIGFLFNALSGILCLLGIKKKNKLK